MPRLFVAIELPVSLTTALARIQPPPAPGVRLVEPDQMHLTLHYLGEANPERTVAALKLVTLPQFNLTCHGVGQFPSAGGATTLWAGVSASESLLALHSAIAASLASEGFQPEARPYMPHITLARCEPDVPLSTVSDFIESNSSFASSSTPVTSFALYSSEFVDGAPRYRREASFRLSANS